MLITLNFGVQLLTDWFAAGIADRIGYRMPEVASSLLTAAGLILLGVLPYILPNAFAGLCIATVLMAVGGGLAEVLISPIVEAIPSDKKAADMSLMHSFYAWGQAGIILLSTLYFTVIGTGLWRWLTMLWALIPLYNAFLFTRVPICTLPSGDENDAPRGGLFSKKIFWLLLGLMVCAGAAENAMAQWASFFAETGLGVSKAMGNILGVGAFAVFVALVRTAYGIWGERMNLKLALTISGILCIISYLMTALSPNPILSLVGCMLCGFSVGLMWPGSLSLSAKSIPLGGTAMFAYLALAGDLGGCLGPSMAGFVSDAAEKYSIVLNGGIGGIKLGLLCVVIFPIIMLVNIFALKRKKA